MITSLAQEASPEEQELQRKLAELHELELRLADKELELATLIGTIKGFRSKYLTMVGRQYAELDKILATIAELEAASNPTDKAAEGRARAARAQATDSSTAVEGEKSSQQDFKPTDNLKRLYRELAKRLHPDLANNETERARRHHLMISVNRAYETQREAELLEILRDWENSPDSIEGDQIGNRLVRVIRKIAQISRRIEVIEKEIVAQNGSEFFQLRLRVQQASAEGRDLLAEMAEQIAKKIALSRQRLAAMTGSQS